MNILEVSNLSHTYKKAVRTALQQVHFSVQKGEIFGLLGPNGGGKTTLFRILSTYFPPAQGSVKIFNLDITEDLILLRQRIGVVFQSPSLDKKLTVLENLIHQGHLYGLHGPALEEKIKDMLQRIGMTQRAGESIETLSGGLQRRVEIAKGLIHSPELLLMDEPSTGLDPGARIDLWNYLFELKKSGITILLTTHLMEEAEKCGRIAILNEGQLVALGTPKALKEEIGGDVISVETPNPDKLCSAIRSQFQIQAMVLNHSVRMERERGHEFIPQLVQAFPDEILSVTVSKPSLEDVFVHRTGHHFWSSKL